MRQVLFAASNLTIFAGYLFIAFVIIPSIEVRLWLTKIGGFFFFVTCGLTHLELAVHAYSTGLPLSEMFSWHMMIIHVVQGLSVWAFVTGLYKEFVRPQLRPRQF